MADEKIKSNAPKSSGNITLEPVVLEIDLAKLPEAPNVDTKPPDAKGLKDLLKLLGSTQKKLIEELQATLDPQGNLKKDKVEEVKGEVVKSLNEMKKKAAEHDETPQSDDALDPKTGTFGVALRVNTKFLLLPESVQAEVLKDAGFKDGAAKNFIAHLKKNYSAPHQKIAHLLQVKAHDLEEKKQEHWIVSRAYETALSFDPGNTEIRMRAAKAKYQWAKQETAPELKKTLYQDVATHISIVVLNEPEKSIFALNALQTLKKVAPELGTPEEAKKFLGKEMMAFLYKIGEGDSDSFKKAKGEVLKSLGLERDAARLAADALIKEIEKKGGPEKSNLSQEDAARLGIPHPKTMWENQLKELEPHIAVLEKYAAESSDLKANLLDLNRVRRMYKLMGKEDKVAEVEAKIKEGSQKIRDGLKVPDGERPTAQQVKDARYVAKLSAAIGDDENLPKDLDAWKSLVDDAAREEVGGKARMNHYGDMLKVWTKFRTKCNRAPESDKEAPMDPSMITERMKEVNGRFLEVANSTIENDFTLGVLENLSSRLIDNDETQLAEHFSADKLDQYVKDAANAEYALEFSGESNPIVMQLYQALRAEGVPAAAMDPDLGGIEGMGKLSAEDVLQFISGRFHNSHVQAALKASKFPMPKDIKEQMKTKSFSKVMGDYYTGEAIKLRDAELKGKKGSTGSWAEVVKNADSAESLLAIATLFDPKNPERLDQLGNFYFMQKRFPEASSALRLASELRAKGDSRSPDQLRAALGDPKDPLAYFENLSKAQRAAVDGVKKLERMNNPTVAGVEVVIKDLKVYGQWVKDAPPELMDDATRLTEQFKVYKAFADLKEVAVKIPRPMGKPVGEVEPGYENAEKDSQGRTILRYEAQSAEDLVRWEMPTIAGEINRLVEKMEKPKVDKFRDAEGVLPSYDKLPPEAKQSFQLRAYISDLLNEVDLSSGKKGERFRKALEPAGLQAYLQERMQFDGLMLKVEDAKAKNDVKLQRSLLIAAMVQARDVGDDHKVKELVKAVEQTLPKWTAENSTSVVRSTELMEVYTSLNTVLATTQLNDERRRIEKICKGTADVLMGQIQEGSGNQPQRLKALLTAREHYASIHAADTVKSLDEDLGKMQGEVEVTLNNGTCMDPKLRLDCVRMLVEVDQALMGKVYEDIQKTGYEPEKLEVLRNNFKTKQLGHLELWKTELQNATSNNSIPPEERFEQSKALLLTALSYRAFIESPIYLLKEKEGLAPLILDCQKVLRANFLKAGLAKAYPNGDIPEGVEQALAARLDGMLISEKYSNLHDRNLPQFIAGLSLEGIAKFGEDYEKGDDLMRQANSLLAGQQVGKENPEEVAQAYKNYEEAAQIFSKLGLTGRVAGAMQPFMKLAENDKLAPEVRAHILMTVAKHYHFAGMKEPLDGVLSKIEELDKKDGPPQVHEMAEIARAMKEMNQITPDPDKTIAILKRLPNNPLAQALLKGVEDAKKADMDQKTLQVVQIMMMKEAQLAKRIEAGDEGKAFADRDYEDLSDEEKTALQQTFSQIVDEAQIRVANGSSANVREALLAISKDKNIPTLSKALENFKNDEMHGTRLFNFLGDVSDYRLTTNEFNQKIADFGLETLTASNKKRNVTGEFESLLSRGSGSYKIVYNFKQEHERIMAPTTWEKVAKVLKIVGTGLQFIPSPWTIGIGTALLLVTAEDAGDVGWAVAGAIPGFAAGKIVKAGVTAKLAVGTARGLKAMAGVEVAVQSGRAVKGFRILEGAALIGGRAEKAVHIVAVAEKGTELSLKSRAIIKVANFSVETVGILAEAGTVAIANQLANTTYKWVRTGKWDTSHLGEHTLHEFLTMVVLFNVGRGLSPLSQRAMKGTEGAFAHYAIERATGITNFYISKKINVAVGLEKKHEGSEWEVLKECVIGDFQMVAANYLTGRLVGKRLQKWESQAHEARLETEMLPGFKRLGYLDTNGNLTAAGQIAMQGVKYRVAIGESPSKILKSLEKIKPADLEAQVKKLGLDPADPNAQVLMGSAITYRLVREAEYKKNKTEGDPAKDVEAVTDSVNKTLEKMGLGKDSPQYEIYRQGLLNSMLLGGRSPQEVAKLVEQGPEIKKAMDESGKKIFGKNANSPEAHAIYSALLNHSLESTENVAATFGKKISAMEKAASSVDVLVRQMGLNPSKGEGKDIRHLLLQNAGLKEWSPEAIAALGSQAPKVRLEIQRNAREIFGQEHLESEASQIFQMDMLSQVLASAKSPAEVPGEVQRWKEAFEGAVQGEGLPKAEQKKFEKLPLKLRQGLAIDALKRAHGPESMKVLLPQLAKMAFEGQENAKKSETVEEKAKEKESSKGSEKEKAPVKKVSAEKPKVELEGGKPKEPPVKKTGAERKQLEEGKGDGAPKKPVGKDRKSPEVKVQEGAEGRQEPAAPGRKQEGIEQPLPGILIQTPQGEVRLNASFSQVPNDVMRMGLPQQPSMLIPPAKGEARIPLQGSKPLTIPGFEGREPLSGEGSRFADVHETREGGEPHRPAAQDRVEGRERDREVAGDRVAGLNLESLSFDGVPANDNVPRVEVDANNVIPIRVRQEEVFSPGVAQVAVAGVAGVAVLLSFVSAAHAQPAQHPLMVDGGVELPIPGAPQLQPGQPKGQEAPVKGGTPKVATDLMAKGKQYKGPAFNEEGMPLTELPPDVPVGGNLPGGHEVAVVMGLIGVMTVVAPRLARRIFRKGKAEEVTEAGKKEGKDKTGGKGTSADSDKGGRQGQQEPWFSEPLYKQLKTRLSDALAKRRQDKAWQQAVGKGPFGKELQALMDAHQDNPKLQAAIRDLVLENSPPVQGKNESDARYADRKIFESNLDRAERAVPDLKAALERHNVDVNSKGAKRLISAVVTDVLLGKRDLRAAGDLVSVRDIVDQLDLRIKKSKNPTKEVSDLGKALAKTAKDLPEAILPETDIAKDSRSRFERTMGDFGFRAGRWTRRTLTSIREQGLRRTLADGSVDLAAAVGDKFAETVRDAMPRPLRNAVDKTVLALTGLDRTLGRIGGERMVGMLEARDQVEGAKRLVAEDHEAPREPAKAPVEPAPPQRSLAQVQSELGAVKAEEMAIAALGKKMTPKDQARARELSQRKKELQREEVQIELQDQMGSDVKPEDLRARAQQKRAEAATKSDGQRIVVSFEKGAKTSDRLLLEAEILEAAAAKRETASAERPLAEPKAPAPEAKHSEAVAPAKAEPKAKAEPAAKPSDKGSKKARVAKPESADKKSAVEKGAKPEVSEKPLRQAQGKPAVENLPPAKTLRDRLWDGIRDKYRLAQNEISILQNKFTPVGRAINSLVEKPYREYQEQPTAAKAKELAGLQKKVTDNVQAAREAAGIIQFRLRGNTDQKFRVEAEKLTDQILAKVLQGELKLNESFDTQMRDAMGQKGLLQALRAPLKAAEAEAKKISDKKAVAEDKSSEAAPPREPSLDEAAAGLFEGALRAGFSNQTHVVYEQGEIKGRVPAHQAQLEQTSAEFSTRFGWDGARADALQRLVTVISQPKVSRQDVTVADKFRNAKQMTEFGAQLGELAVLAQKGAERPVLEAQAKKLLGAFELAGHAEFVQALDAFLGAKVPTPSGEGKRSEAKAGDGFRGAEGEAGVGTSLGFEGGGAGREGQSGHEQSPSHPEALPDLEISPLADSVPPPAPQVAETREAALQRKAETMSDSELGQREDVLRQEVNAFLARLPEGVSVEHFEDKLGEIRGKFLQNEFEGLALDLTGEKREMIELERAFNEIAFKYFETQAESLRDFAEQHAPEAWGKLQAELQAGRQGEINSRRIQDGLYEVMSQGADAVVAKELGLTDRKDIPERLKTGYQFVLGSLLEMGLVERSFSPEVMSEFLREATLMHQLSPKPDVWLQHYQMSRHLLLGSRPTADSHLRHITQNMRGVRRMFGEAAPEFFSRAARLVTELRDPTGKPTNFFLVVERGHFEANSGIQIAILEGPMKGRESSTGFTAKLGLHFGAGDTLQVVNFQGPMKGWGIAPKERAPEDSMKRLKETLGKGNVFDMLVTTAVMIGREKGFSKIEGIREEAQTAVMDERRNMEALGKDTSGRLYDSTFARLGFRPPEPGSDFHSLDLTSLEVYREAPAPKKLTKKGKVDRRSSAVEGNHSPGEFVREVISRRNEANRVRREKWDKKAPEPVADQVVSFWKTFARGLNELQFEATHREFPPETLPQGNPLRLTDLGGRAARPAVQVEVLPIAASSKKAAYRQGGADEVSPSQRPTLRAGAESPPPMSTPRSKENSMIGVAQAVRADAAGFSRLRQEFSSDFADFSMKELREAAADARQDAERALEVEDRPTAVRNYAAARALEMEMARRSAERVLEDAYPADMKQNAEDASRQAQEVRQAAAQEVNPVEQNNLLERAEYLEAYAAGAEGAWNRALEVHEAPTRRGEALPNSQADTHRQPSSLEGVDTQRAEAPPEFAPEHREEPAPITLRSAGNEAPPAPKRGAPDIRGRILADQARREAQHAAEAQFLAERVELAKIRAGSEAKAMGLNQLIATSKELQKQAEALRKAGGRENLEIAQELEAQVKVFQERVKQVAPNLRERFAEAEKRKAEEWAEVSKGEYEEVAPSESSVAQPAAPAATALEGEITILGRETEGAASEGSFQPVTDRRQTVSRRHAQLRRAPDGSLFLKDLNSKYGTRVWDEARRAVEADANGEFSLKEGYRIELGSSEKPIFLEVTPEGKIVQKWNLPLPKAPPRRPLPAPKAAPLPRVSLEVREGNFATRLAEILRLGEGGDTAAGREACNEQMLPLLQSLFHETTPELTTALGKFLESAFAASASSGFSPQARKNFSAQVADLIRRTVESGRSGRGDFRPLFDEARAVEKAFGFGSGHEVTLALESLISVTLRTGRRVGKESALPQKPGRIATREEVMEAPPLPVGRSEAEVPEVSRKAAYAPQAAEEIQAFRGDVALSPKRGVLQKLAGWLGIGGVVGVASTAFMDSAEAAVRGGAVELAGNPSVMAFGAMAAVGILGMAFSRGSKPSQKVEAERIVPLPPENNPFGQRTFEYRRPGASDYEFLISFGGVATELVNGAVVRRPRWLLTVNPENVPDLPFRRGVEVDGQRKEGMGHEVFPGQEIRSWDGKKFVFTPPEMDVTPQKESPWKQERYARPAAPQEMAASSRKAAYESESLPPQAEPVNAPEQGGLLKKLSKLFMIGGGIGVASSAFEDSAHAMVKTGGEAVLNNPTLMAAGAMFAVGVFGAIFSRSQRKTQRPSRPASESLEAAPVDAPLPPPPRLPRFGDELPPAIHEAHGAPSEEASQRPTVPPAARDHRDRDTIPPERAASPEAADHRDAQTLPPASSKKAGYARQADQESISFVPPAGKEARDSLPFPDPLGIWAVPKFSEKLAAIRDSYQEIRNLLAPYLPHNMVSSEGGLRLAALAKENNGIEGLAAEAHGLLAKISQELSSMNEFPALAHTQIQNLAPHVAKLKNLLQVLDPALHGKEIRHNPAEVQPLINEAMKLESLVGSKPEKVAAKVPEAPIRSRAEVEAECDQPGSEAKRARWREEMFKRQGSSLKGERKAAGDALLVMGEIETFRKSLKDLAENGPPGNYKVGEHQSPEERAKEAAEYDLQEKRLLKLLDANLKRLPGLIEMARAEAKGETAAPKASEEAATGKDSPESSTIKPTWYREIAVLLERGQSRGREMAKRARTAIEDVVKLRQEIQIRQELLAEAELPLAESTRLNAEIQVFAAEMKQALAILEPWKAAVKQINRNGIAKSDFNLDRSPVDYRPVFDRLRLDNPEITAQLYENYFTGKNSPFEGNSVTFEVRKSEERSALVDFIAEKARREGLTPEPAGPDLKLRGPEGIEFFVKVKVNRDSGDSPSPSSPGSVDRDSPTVPPRAPRKNDREDETIPPPRAKPEAKENEKSSEAQDSGAEKKTLRPNSATPHLLIGLGVGLGALLAPSTLFAATESMVGTASQGGISNFLTGLGLSLGVLAMAYKGRGSRDRGERARIEVMESELHETLNQNHTEGTTVEVWLEKTPEDSWVHHLKAVAVKRGISFEIKDIETGGAIHIEIGKDGRAHATTNDAKLARHTPAEVILVAEVEPIYSLDQQISAYAKDGVKKIHLNASAKDISPRELAASARVAAETGVDLELSDPNSGELFLRVTQGSGGTEIKLNNLEVNPADAATLGALQQLTRSAMAAGCQKIQIGRGLSLTKNRRGTDLAYNFSTTLPMARVEAVFGEYLGFESSRVLKSGAVGPESLVRFWRGAMQHATEMEQNIHMGRLEAAAKKAEYAIFGSEAGWVQRWQNSVAGMRRFAADEVKRARLEETFLLLENYSQAGEDFLGFQAFNGRAFDDNSFELMRLFEKGSRAPELRLDLVLNTIFNVLGPHDHVQLFGAVVGTVFKGGIPKIGNDGRDVYDFAAQNEYHQLMATIEDLKHSSGRHRVTVIPEDRLQGSNFRSPQFTKTPEWIIESFDPDGKVRRALAIEVTQADAAKIQDNDVVATIHKKVEQLTGHQFAKAAPIQQSRIVYNLYNSAGNETALIEMTRKAVEAEARTHPAGQMDNLQVLVVFQNKGQVRGKAKNYLIEFKAGRWVSGPAPTYLPQE